MNKHLISFRYKQFNAPIATSEVYRLNLSQAMKYKSELKANYALNAKMLDASPDGFVLCIQKRSGKEGSAKQLADFAVQKQLALQDNKEYYLISAKKLISRT